MALAPYLIYGDTPLILDSRPSEGDLAELDAVDIDVRVACAAIAGWRAAATAAGYTRGNPLPGWAGMFVRTLSAAQEAGCITLTVAGHGIMGGGDKRKRTISCAGQQVSVGPIEKVVLVWNTEEKGVDPVGGGSVLGKRRIPKVNDDGEVQYKTIGTPTGTAERWNINQPILNVSDTYFSTTAPVSSAAGTANTPPSAPTPPSYIWGGYQEEMRYNHPSGWVLDDRQSEELVVGSLWRVTDTWAYYYAAQPD